VQFCVAAFSAADLPGTGRLFALLEPCLNRIGPVPRGFKPTVVGIVSTRAGTVPTQG
jgi:hypothetical protein